MDMWQAFMTSTRQCVPQAKIVHDKFHVAKYLGEAVDRVRRAEHKELNQTGDSLARSPPARARSRSCGVAATLGRRSP
jgi:transposase